MNARSRLNAVLSEPASTMDGLISSNGICSEVAGIQFALSYPHMCLQDEDITIARLEQEIDNYGVEENDDE